MKYEVVGLGICSHVCFIPLLNCTLIFPRRQQIGDYTEYICIHVYVCIHTLYMRREVPLIENQSISLIESAGIILIGLCPQPGYPGFSEIV
jgi:hypothetical protein